MHTLSFPVHRWIVSLVGAITYPLIFIHLFIPNSKQMFGIYILIQSCTLIITLLISAVSGSISSLHDKLLFFFPIPAVSIAALLDSPARYEAVYFLIASSIFTLLSLAIPLWRALPLYQSMRAGTKPVSAKTQSKIDRLLR